MTTCSSIDHDTGAITYTGSGEDFESFQTPASAFTLTVRVPTTILETVPTTERLLPMPP